MSKRLFKELNPLRLLDLLKKSKKYRKLLPYTPLAVLVVGFGLVGVVLTISSHAANSVTAQEAESGQLNGNASNQTGDSNTVSGGSFVLFGAGSGGGGNPPPPPPPPPPSGGGDDPTATTCPTSFSVVGTDPTITQYKPTLCEDFNNGLGTFGPYTGGGDGTVIDGSSSRQPGQCSNGGGYLALKQDSAGHTCGGSVDAIEQSYGYWEMRMRAYKTGGGGSPGHPVLILWSPGNVWNDGEMDFFETDIGSPAGGFLHCVGNPQQNCFTIPDDPVDYSQWHVYGFEWRADGGRGFIDGKPWWSTTTNDWSITKPGHPTIQLDNFGSAPAELDEMDVDWIHAYK